MRLTSLFGWVAAAAALTACLGDQAEPTYGWSGSRVAERRQEPPVSGAGQRGSGPDFGETVHQAVPPPPMSGGTLAVATSELVAVAADPDRDAIYVVDLADGTVATVTLLEHDEPGRVVLDNAGRAHVALRGSGALATIDLANGNAITRRPACALPRGVAWEEATDQIHVACAGGELVTFAAAGGPPSRVVRVARDLRDVVVTPRGLVVSTFRDADIVRLAADGTVQEQSLRLRRPSLTARVAWRMIADPQAEGSDDPANDVLVVAQRAPTEDDPPPSVPAGYYVAPDPCAGGGPVPLLGGRRAFRVPSAVLPVDVATDGVTTAIVAAGNAYLPSASPLVMLYADVDKPCLSGGGVPLPRVEVTSVAYGAATKSFYALSREPAMLVEIEAKTWKITQRITLSEVSRRDTGHAVFHASSGMGVACASCHPEGRDDGHAWRSRALGARRTPSLLGTLAGTAPYHWNGEAKDLGAVMSLTFEGRMQGPALTTPEKEAASAWVGSLSPLRTSLSPVPDAAQRGRAIFEGTRARCVSCHAGPLRTNNLSVDLGRGEALQVPSLVGVVHRAPYLHDGSAPNLRAILQAPHGGATVESGEIEDLVTYLESL